MSWDDVGFVKSSKHRIKILSILSTRPMLPTEISSTLGIHISQVTRSLIELENRDLVKCITPNLRKGRLYVITEQGKKVII